MARKQRRTVKKTASTNFPRLNSTQKKDLQILLNGLSKPSAETSQVARVKISEVIRAPRNSQLDPIDAILFSLSTTLSLKALSGYASLDWGHIENIQSMITKIQNYAEDVSQRRPLNFLMLASPGAGKSHFIKCIAAEMRQLKVSAITFNMTALQTNDDLIPALDAARNAKVEDQIPLLFLDEFDSKPGNISTLLPLLWDGEINLGQRDLKLGRVIIVLAGSDPSLPGMMDSARSMRSDVSIPDGTNPKIVDLLSRINGGVIQIPAFYDPTHSIDRRADKACVAIQLLRLRFGHQLKSVPRALLNFIVETEFRYGVRSIAHLVELIPHKKNVERLHVKDLKLPIRNAKSLKESSLAYHLLHQDQVHGIVDFWKSVEGSDVDVPSNNELDAYVPRWRFPGAGTETDWVLQRLLRVVVGDRVLKKGRRELNPLF